jgi:hypothetical protein
MYTLGKKLICFANAHNKNINQIQTQLGEILFCFEKAFIIPHKYVSIVLHLHVMKIQNLCTLIDVVLLFIFNVLKVVECW